MKKYLAGAGVVAILLMVYVEQVETWWFSLSWLGHSPIEWIMSIGGIVMVGIFISLLIWGKK